MRTSNLDLAAALGALLSEQGSDLHLKVGNRPLIRVDGELRPLDPGASILEPHDTEEALHGLLTSARIAEFEEAHELDFAYSVSHLARFRVNAYKQRGTISLVLRVVPTSVPSLAGLDLPPAVARLAEQERGIVLVTGTTGSGKSTTLAAMIEHVNDTASKHVVTIEDPIEYLHSDRRSSIDQREVGSDTDSFRTALRRVLRQDPDVILIGEMRDEETVRAALSAAETGHLILSTLHTQDAAETVNRILEFFQPGERQQVRATLAGSLRGIVSQRLVPAADGHGRTAICEILVMTGRVHDLIIDPEETGGLVDVIAEGEYYGMQTFDQALFAALQAGKVTMETALRVASHPHDFELLVDAQGRRASSIENVAAFSGG
ncbi:MAG TPA: PilT/PilU family type 4a pilus ATPase [Solirubrobacterales bacterium]|nr:PilT/PilU family type 4a pilus ATPase [Solirubrobacterales bacterium]